MTQEEKQLLLKDLSARLPYGVILDNGIKARSIDILTKIVSGVGTDKKIDDVKYYLRPMSSMTAGEEYEYHQYKSLDYPEIYEMKHTKMLEITALHFSRAIDWLNKHHFDYRGLIPMGLALEAPEGMYNN